MRRFPIFVVVQYDLGSFQDYFLHCIHLPIDEYRSASFLGTRIILRQVSKEAESIFDLILALHRACGGEWKGLQKGAGVEDGVLQAFLEYAGQFLGNIGNYKAVGDAKFVPRLSQESFQALASTSPDASRYYEAAREGIFAHEDRRRMHLGYIDDGHVSQYYPDSPSVTKEEIISIGEFVDGKKLEIYNTRLHKTPEGDFDLLIASAETAPPADGGDIGTQTEWELEGKLQGKKLRLVYGDHSRELKKISQAIELARENAGNKTQAMMHAEYARSFQTGSAEAFKRSQQSWVQDKGPMVECNIGFIESYRDPHGVRAEWEGFVAMVNQERTRAFGRLVDMAPSLIPKLPWSTDFEKDHFLSPDFTSLEVLSFAGSMIPAGINIPWVLLFKSNSNLRCIDGKYLATWMTSDRRWVSRTSRWATSCRPRRPRNPRPSSGTRIWICFIAIVMRPLRCRWAFTSCSVTVRVSSSRRRRRAPTTSTWRIHLSAPCRASPSRPGTDRDRHGARCLATSRRATKSAGPSASPWR